MKYLSDVLKFAPTGGLKGLGTNSLANPSTNAPSIFTNFLSSVIGVMTIVAIIWFVFLFISGAISYMTSGGDKAAIESAQKRIINSVIGLVIVIIAIYIIKLVGYLLGVPNILNFQVLFGQVTGISP